ncbi:hypothetical protein JCM10213v2_005785 [Rhodosporidiobolus nylandii]
MLQDVLSLRHPQGQPSPATLAKLEELEDREVHELLERVGGQLTELRVREDDEADEVAWPEIEAFRLEDGKVDWASYGIAYSVILATSSVPATLITPPPARHFSLRSLGRSLERLYVLFPPATWQPFLLKTLPHIYRWEDPLLTGSYAAGYALLWLADLLPLVPVAVLAWYLAKARLFPPSPEELVAQAEERAARTKEAAELGKQLQTSSQVGFGIAGEGVKGLWSEVKERVGRGGSEDGAEEKSIASGLGSSALLGGIAGMPREAADRLRKRTSHGRSTSFASLEASTSSPPSSPSAGGPSQPNPASSAAFPRPDEPARGVSGGDEDVSLYRLARNMARVFGPHLQLWAEELAELSEGVKNVVHHPSHPASLPVLLRLLGLCLTILLMPTWIVFKGLFLYLGLEFFVLWHARELWPQYRRALMPWWWIFVDAPADADYALYVLRQRSAEGRPLKGSQTIKRQSRVEGSRGVRAKLGLRLPRSMSAPSDLASEEERVIGTFFALHLSTPGNLHLTSMTLSFTPTRKIRHFGKLASRLSSSSTSDEDSFASTSTYTAGSADGVDIEVEEIKAVKKENSWVKAMQGLVISTKGGEVFRFTNVAKRDECFNKLLSVSSASWETA